MSPAGRALVLSAACFALLPRPAGAQTQNYFGSSGALNGATWSTNPGGPFTSAFVTTNGGVMNFHTAATITGGSVRVAGINATADVTLTTAGGTITTLGNGVVPITVAAGATLDFRNQGFTTSGTAGFVKNGGGVLALAGADYQGGFTLNAGTVVALGVNAMGGGASNTLTLNGGVLASNGNRVFTNKYGGGITVGGDVQFGATTGLASATANLTFDNAVNLGSTGRTLTHGNNGLVTFSGALTNSVSSGSASAVTFAAAPGTTGAFVLGGQSTYTGTTTIASGTVRLTGGNDRLPTGTVVAFGQAGGAGLGTLDLNGTNQTVAGLSSVLGTNATAAANTVTSAPLATLTLGGSGDYSFGGTAAGSGRISGLVSLVKTGTGTQTLGGVHTFTGLTTVAGGTLNVTGSLDSAVTVTGGTLTGSGTLNGAVTVGAGGTLQGTAGATLTVNAPVTVAAGGTLAVDLGGAAGQSAIDASASKIAAAFALTLTDGVAFRLVDDGNLTAGQSYTVLVATAGTAPHVPAAGNYTVASGSGRFTFSNTNLNFHAPTGRLTLTFTPVPEPAGVLAVGAAGLGLARFVRRVRAGGNKKSQPRSPNRPFSVDPRPTPAA